MRFTTYICFTSFLWVLGCSGAGGEELFEAQTSTSSGGSSSDGVGGSSGDNVAGEAGSGSGGDGSTAGTAGQPQGGSGGTEPGGSGGEGQAGTGIGGDGGAGGDPGTGGTSGSTACYSEAYDPMAPIGDLKTGFQGWNWLPTALGILERRYPTGHFILDAEQNDYQLEYFVDTSSWEDFVWSLDTMVHEETHGWDFEHSQYGSHVYALTDALHLEVPELQTWPRNTIPQYIHDGSTSMYDQTYLTGEQGTYDAIFLFDELTAYGNGLATLTAVHEEIPPSISARDGLAAHLLYLELYLKAGREHYPQMYAALKANAAWQKLVRYEWARGHFWDGQAKPYTNLTIDADAIWAHVNEPANLDEIQQFTGQLPSEVACHPE